MNTCVTCHRMILSTNGAAWAGCRIGRWYTVEQAGFADGILRAATCDAYVSIDGPAPEDGAAGHLALVASARALTRPENIPAQIIAACDADRLVELGREVTEHAVVVTVAASPDAPMAADLIIPHSAGVNPMRMTLAEIARVAHETGGA